MNLKIRSGTAGYNNKILVSDGNFSLGKNDEVNLMVPAIKSHKVTQTATNSNDALLPHGSHAPNISHKSQEPKTITHNDKKIALTAQSAFLNNFENVVNRRVDIREDIKHYQDTLSYASSKVDHTVWEKIFICFLVT